MKTSRDLKEILESKLNGKGYKGYKDLTGEMFDYGFFTLKFDYVQGDPFASPSKIRAIIKEKSHKFPREYYDTKIKKTAFKDYLARVTANKIYSVYDRVKGSGKSGLINIDRPGQEIIERTAIGIDGDKIEVRLEVGLPAFGRKIAGREAGDMLVNHLYKIIKEAINGDKIDKNKLEKHIELAQDQEFVRGYLRDNDYCAFVANGAVLPRENGISQRPLRNGAVKFASPETMEIEIDCPFKGKIKGMGVKNGVTLIVGGGYHGKSTLLKALELGIYNHIAGDGREFVITDEDSVKVRAEDGRRVEKVNISPFINNLPNKKDTVKFESDNASGSTSQAANIMEAVEMKSRLLLIDEDTSATNFMIRDKKMKMLIHEDKEPITPFIDRVREIHSDYSISTVLVIGSSGEYFHKADCVIMMDEYKAHDITEKAKELFKTEEDENKAGEMCIESRRSVMKNSFPRFEGKTKIKSKGLHSIIVERDEIDLAYVEQLIDSSQTNAIRDIIKYSSRNIIDGNKTVYEVIEEVFSIIEKQGLEGVAASKGHPGNLAMPRKFEVAAAFNRYRKLKIK